MDSGICDLFFLLMLLSQKYMAERIKPKDEFQCTVLEVRPTPGFGVTISVILTSGTVSIGSTIVAAGLHGPIVTKVRAIIVPPSLSEIRDTSKKFSYTGYVKKVSGAMAVKIAGRGLEAVVPGSPVVVPAARQSIDVVKAMVMSDIEDISRLIVTGGGGLCVNASTLGSLEALVDFLTTSGVPIKHIELGDVSISQVFRAAASPIRAHKCILAFDVGVSKSTLSSAERQDVVVITANIIYNLMDKWKGYAAREKINFVPKTPFRLVPIPEYAITLIEKVRHPQS
jgi:translation initiation factor 5B